METDSHGIRNIGRLQTSKGLFSNARSASLSTVTTFKPKRFFITAENDANTLNPGNFIVLQTM